MVNRAFLVLPREEQGDADGAKAAYQQATDSGHADHRPLARPPRLRYNSTRKNLFDLRRVAVVHNLHVTAPPGHDRQLQQAA